MNHETLADATRDGELRWFHCILTTYGAWLPGDPRGFRTRHHREHVDGDYKIPPPPGSHAGRHLHARNVQTFSAVTLTPSERMRLGRSGIGLLRNRAIDVLAAAVARQHIHLQFRCARHRVVDVLGDVKRALWFVRRDAGAGGRLWGRGRKIVPILSPDHQKRVLNYILDHRAEGAWVWCWRDGDP